MQKWFYKDPEVNIMLECDFDPTAKLEIQVNPGEGFVQVDPAFFRSWGYARRVNEKPFNGKVYFMLRNEIACPMSFDKMMDYKNR